MIGIKFSKLITKTNANILYNTLFKSLNEIVKNNVWYFWQANCSIATGVHGHNSMYFNNNGRTYLYFFPTKGKTYTFSCKYKGSAWTLQMINISETGGNFAGLIRQKSIIASSDWSNLTYTFTVPTNANDNLAILITNSGLYICEPKIEEGTLQTDFVPNSTEGGVISKALIVALRNFNKERRAA